LLRLIREEVEEAANDASIRLNKGARLGWVAQEVDATDDTIMDVVLAADMERARLMKASETETDPDKLGESGRRSLAGRLYSQISLHSDYGQP